MRATKILSFHRESKKNIAPSFVVSVAAHILNLIDQQDYNECKNLIIDIVSMLTKLSWKGQAVQPETWVTRITEDMGDIFLWSLGWIVT